MTMLVVPQVGQRVIASDAEDDTDEIGTILEIHGNRVAVEWDWTPEFKALCESLPKEHKFVNPDWVLGSTIRPHPGSLDVVTRMAEVAERADTQGGR